MGQIIIIIIIINHTGVNVDKMPSSVRRKDVGKAARCFLRTKTPSVWFTGQKISLLLTVLGDYFKATTWPGDDDLHELCRRITMCNRTLFLWTVLRGPPNSRLHGCLSCAFGLSSVRFLVFSLFYVYFIYLNIGGKGRKNQYNKHMHDEQ